jgi:hypothetical protein
LNLSTGAGCQWSATSSAAWLSLTAGINGVSGGPVSYSLQANPSTIPRQGAIQIGNGFASVTVNFLQAGETATITVTTQINCPWTVNTTAPWLTLNTGTSGLGSGTFTLTAAADTQNTDRVGTVTLLGQTLDASLTVIDGSPVGTPGVATVTISGSPFTSSYCPTGVRSQCTRITEASILSITIAGNTYIVPMSTGSASWGAGYLVSLINQPYSPVVATASGATVTIRSSVNGADTNYPISTSFTFLPMCVNNVCSFFAPNFLAAASGPTLTGGTN